MNGVRNELSSTLNRRRANLQKGEQIYEAVGQETQRNATANKAYMNKLRRGSNTPENLIRKAAITRKNQAPLGRYIKTSGVNGSVKELKCTKNSSGSYLCQTGAGRQTGGKTRRKRTL